MKSLGFLMRLFTLLALADRARFCLVKSLNLGLIVSLAIGRVEFIDGEIAVSFSEYFL